MVNEPSVFEPLKFDCIYKQTFGSDKLKRSLLYVELTSAPQVNVAVSRTTKIRVGSELVQSCRIKFKS